jgi:hypothetical protein
MTEEQVEETGNVSEYNAREIGGGDKVSVNILPGRLKTV